MLMISITIRRKLQSSDTNNFAAFIAYKLPCFGACMNFNTGLITSSPEWIVNRTTQVDRTTPSLYHPTMAPRSRGRVIHIFGQQGIIRMVEKVIDIGIGGLLFPNRPTKLNSLCHQPFQVICALLAKSLQGFIFNDPLGFQLQVVEHVLG